LWREETIGSYDNQFRHAITKMAHIHFVTNKFYKKKVERMGENKKKVFNVGSLAFSNFDKLKFNNKFDLQKKYKFKLRKENFLVTIHSETLEKFPSKKRLKIIFNTFEKFKDFSFIFTAANSDQGGNEINRLIKNFIKKKINMYFIDSFGKEDYFSMIRLVSGVIGNSSSGIIEVPYFTKGSINLGQRQLGRISSKSVINVDYNQKDLSRSILKIISKKFKLKIKKNLSPYYKKNTIRNIKKVLTKTNLENITLKRFNF